MVLEDWISVLISVRLVVKNSGAPPKTTKRINRSILKKSLRFSNLAVLNPGFLNTSAVGHIFAAPSGNPVLAFHVTRLALAAALLLSLAACGKSRPRADLVFINGAEPESIDPHVVTD